MYFPLTRTRNQKLNGFDMKNAYWMTGCLFFAGVSSWFWELTWKLARGLLTTFFSTATRCNGSKYVFPDTDVCSAAAFGRFLCRDYDSAEEEPWFWFQSYFLYVGFWTLLRATAAAPRVIFAHVCVCVTVPGVNLGIECMIVLPQIQRLLRICFNYEFGKSVNPTFRHAQLLLMIWFTSLLSLSLSFLWASSSSRPPADRSWDRTKILFGISPTTGWWFQLCFIFHNIWNNNPNLLIFFRGVETTNQNKNGDKMGYKGAVMGTYLDYTDLISGVVDQSNLPRNMLFGLKVEYRKIPWLEKRTCPPFFYWP